MYVVPVPISKIVDETFGCRDRENAHAREGKRGQRSRSSGGIQSLRHNAYYVRARNEMEKKRAPHRATARVHHTDHSCRRHRPPDHHRRRSAAVAAGRRRRAERHVTAVARALHYHVLSINYYVTSSSCPAPTRHLR